MKQIAIIKKYLPFSKAAWMTTLAYKFHVFLWMISDALSAILMCLLWVAVYKAKGSGGVINGFTLVDMIQYVLIARIASQLVAGSESFWTLSEDIRSGNISMTLMKPISYRLKSLFSSLGAYVASFVMFVLPMMVVLFVVMGQLGGKLPTLVQVLMFVLTTFLGLIIMDSLDFLFGLTSIFTGALFGLGQIKSIIYHFFSGAMIPIVFFPRVLKEVVEFLPYSSVISSPIQIILGKMGMDQFGGIVLKQLFWIVILNILCKVLFDRFIKHVIVVGG